MEKTFTKKEKKAAVMDEAKATLLKFIKPGDTVYTILRHVSSSGMSRSIDIVIMRDGQPWVISYLVAQIAGERIDEKHGGIKVGGCGMDMGAHLVYGLSYSLFRDGFYCTGDKDCPANDHNNDGMMTGNKEGYSTERKHSDPGYSLRRRWL